MPILVALSICAFAAALIIRIVDPLVPEIARDLGQTPEHMAPQLGGEDGRTLFCTTYDGTIEQQQQKLRHGSIHTVRVSVPRPPGLPG